jgi:hypothetical protein
MKRRARAIAASISPVKRLGLLALVFTFALQAYFIQTHLHPQQFAPVMAVTLAADDPASHLPADPLDPITCKLCREIVHSGAAMAPAALPCFSCSTGSPPPFPSRNCRPPPWRRKPAGKAAVLPPTDLPILARVMRKTRPRIDRRALPCLFGFGVQSCSVRTCFAAQAPPFFSHSQP